MIKYKFNLTKLTENHPFVKGIVIHNLVQEFSYRNFSSVTTIAQNAIHHVYFLKKRQLFWRFVLAFFGGFV